MIKPQLKLFWTLLALCMVSTTFAQQTVATCGGKATGNGGTACYTIGQVAYQSVKSSNFSITEGVQQPYEIFVVTSIEDAIGISLNMTAYPNPVADYLTLKVDEIGNTELSYVLFNAIGRQLSQSVINGQETKIPMSGLLPDIYFIKIVQDNNTVKTFKIVKR